MTIRKTYGLRSQSDVAIQIERLVHAIEFYDMPAFKVRGEHSAYDGLEETRLSPYIEHIQVMMDLFDERHEYRYSECLQAFRKACQDIGLERHPRGPVCLNGEGSAYLDHHRSMNVLVARIRHLTDEAWYCRVNGDRRYEARKQERRVIGYTDTVLDRHARTVIVRVDLYYRQEAHVRLRVERMFKDLDRLISEHERNPIFDHLTGYICAVEQGEDRGYHIHAAYFFNGKEIRGDVYKAQQLGELWERITLGHGCYNSCNHDKERYKSERGIGIVYRSDPEIRLNVHKTMRYLVKDAQHLLLKPEGARCVRMGMCR